MFLEGRGIIVYGKGKSRRECQPGRRTRGSGMLGGVLFHVPEVNKDRLKQPRFVSESIKNGGALIRSVDRILESSKTRFRNGWLP